VRQDREAVSLHSELTDIILIHGTFARGTSWSRTGSDLTRPLKESFPDASTLPFDWTGVNSHDARIAAGRELATFIRQLQADHPNRKIALIGHSHGGNVLLYALRESGIASVVTSVVFLGTPFFRFKKIPYEQANRIFVNVIGVVAFILSMLVAWFAWVRLTPEGLHFLSLSESKNRTVAVVGTALSIFVPLMSFSLVAALAQQTLGVALAKILLRKRRSVFLQISAPALERPALVCRSIWDEAYLYLAGLALVTSTPFFIWSVTLICIRMFPVMFVLSLIAQCSVHQFGLTHSAEPISETFIGYAFAAALLLYLSAVLAPVVLSVVLALLGGNPAAFGWLGFLGAAVIEVRAAVTPWIKNDGSVRILTSRQNRRNVFSLVHSSYYSDPAVLNSIVGFLKGEPIGVEFKRPTQGIRFNELVVQRIVAALALIIFMVGLLR
jgi:pimeloyl-ACP methyl ester carboxylesterase